MKEELQKKLFESFPNLYSNRSETLMCFGFQCNDAWFDLLWNLSGKLENIIFRFPENERNQYRSIQVKEKFGSLRFCMSKRTNEISDLIVEAEIESKKICIFCYDYYKIISKSGIIRSWDGCLISICDDCCNTWLENNKFDEDYFCP